MAIDVIANMKAKVGRQLAGDGADVLPWAGRQADLVTQPFGKYYQAAIQGYIFNGVTVDAGFIPGTDAVSTTQGLSLYNPNGSGVNLVILNARIAYVTGTFGGGELLWTANTNPASAATTGTAGHITNAKISGGTGTKASFLSASTVPEVPTLIRVMCSMLPILATTADASAFFEVVDEVDGAIIVPPGCRVGLASDATSGSSPVLAGSMCWAEVPA